MVTGIKSIHARWDSLCNNVSGLLRLHMSLLLRLLPRTFATTKCGFGMCTLGREWPRLGTSTPRSITRKLREGVRHKVGSRFNSPTLTSESHVAIPRAPARNRLHSLRSRDPLYPAPLEWCFSANHHNDKTYDGRDHNIDVGLNPDKQASLRVRIPRMPGRMLLLWSGVQTHQ